MTPEQHLYVAVMKQAVVDLFIGTPSSSNPREGDLIRRAALSFLTDASGPWAAMRAEICVDIDRDPDQVRDSIVAVLDGEDLPYLGDVRGNGLDKARAMWAEQKAREAAAQAERQRRKAEKKAAAPKPQIAAAPVAPAAPPPQPPPARSRNLGHIKETTKAAKPWLTPPRSPEDDFWYGLASSA